MQVYGPVASEPEPAAEVAPPPPPSALPLGAQGP
jgi:hypothetical protein